MSISCRFRLSKDGRENESMSISNQKALLRDFAEKNGLLNYEFYVDDGYTGRNFNRPSFQRMIADIEAGKVVPADILQSASCRIRLLPSQKPT